MDNHKSIMAVKNAIGGGEKFSGYMDVHVTSGDTDYIYKNLLVIVGYNCGYMQMEVSIDWDRDPTQPGYKTIGLHAGYNSNFQEFTYANGVLSWQDGRFKISARFSV